MLIIEYTKSPKAERLPTSGDVYYVDALKSSVLLTWENNGVFDGFMVTDLKTFQSFRGSNESIRKRVLYGEYQLVTAKIVVEKA